MKKILNVFLLLVASFLLVACDMEISNPNIKTHVVSVYDEEAVLLNNYFVENNKLFDKELLETLEPSSEAFTFLYWSLSIDGEEFKFELPITENISLYAVVKEINEPLKKFNVKVIGLDGIEIETYQVTEGDTFSKSMIEGHLSIENNEEFDKWVIEGTNTEYVFDQVITADVVIRAKKIISQNANFDLTLYNGYYQGFGLNEYVDQQLKTNLKTAIRRNYSPGSYKSGHWHTLRAADLHPTRPGYLWTIYDSGAISASNSGGNGGQWNKEHVVPQNWLKSAGLSNFGNDQHNLRAAEVQVNSNRGNLKFVDSNGTYGRTGGGYYPGLEHVGDVARILMYMLVIHDGTSLTIDKMIIGNTWDTLLKWHLEDPVDDFEIYRNNIVFGDQGNRNPFIDYPDLVYFVWNSQYGHLIN